MGKATDWLIGLNKTYARLWGAQVKAIRDIPQGCNPFSDLPADQYVLVPADVIDGLDGPLKWLVQDMCVKQGGAYYVPKDGMNSINAAWYLNHSKDPNMRTEDGGDTFIAIRDIAAGEELTVDYDTFDESTNGR